MTSVATPATPRPQPARDTPTRTELSTPPRRSKTLDWRPPEGTVHETFGPTIEQLKTILDITAADGPSLEQAPQTLYRETHQLTHARDSRGQC